MCEACGSCFDSSKGLKVHLGGNWCRNPKEMNQAELRKLHRTRQVSSTRRGKTVTRAELVSVSTCEGKFAKSCGSFVYLGTLKPRPRRRCKEELAWLWEALEKCNDCGRATKSLELPKHVFTKPLSFLSCSITWNGDPQAEGT